MIICATCIHLLTHLYFIIAINTGLEIERVCRPRPGEDMGDYYVRAREYFDLVGDAEEKARVIWLADALG